MAKDAIIDIPDKPELALKIVGEISALHIKSPNDVIVLQIRKPVTMQEVERVIAMWRETTGLPNPVVALVDGVEVKVVKPS